MKTTAFLSAMTGFLFGLIGYFVLLLLEIDQPFQLAVFSGLLVALLLFPVLVVYGRIMEKRYAEFEKGITSPIFYKANGNFKLDNGKVRNGNIYFCQSGMICVCLEEKPYTVDEILLQDIEGLQFHDFHLNITAKDGRRFVITLPDAPKIIDVLREKDWI